MRCFFRQRIFNIRFVYLDLICEHRVLVHSCVYFIAYGFDDTFVFNMM